MAADLITGWVTCCILKSNHFLDLSRSSRGRCHFHTDTAHTLPSPKLNKSCTCLTLIGYILASYWLPDCTLHTSVHSLYRCMANWHEYEALNIITNLLISPEPFIRFYFSFLHWNHNCKLVLMPMIKHLIKTIFLAIFLSIPKILVSVCLDVHSPVPFH